MKLAVESMTSAAMTSLGIPHTATQTEVRTKLRQALENRRYSAFSQYPKTYAYVIPASAAMELQRHFPGTVSISMLASKAEEAWQSEGYLRKDTTQGELFHPDSVDFEDRREALAERAELISEDMLLSGVNPIQAFEVNLMDTPVSVMLSGGAHDFYTLHAAVHRMLYMSHPASRAVTMDIWKNLEEKEPLIAQAFLEVSP